MNDFASPHPKPRIYVEKIGGTEWTLQERLLDVNEEVALWSGNPRLQTSLPVINNVPSEVELEAALERTSGYDALRRSIDDLGQMEAIYAWLPNATAKYLVLEGATRVAILRQLERKYKGQVKEGNFRHVRAKILPPEFGERERAILLARIHVRGSGVRAWGRYIEARFIYETVVGKSGQPALMNQAQMAQYMEKSESWVNRLKHAYEFALRFVEHVDSDNAEGLAAEHFSTLEEVSKAKTIGSQLRDYANPAYDILRQEVFDMVRNDAFKEYRDARFLKEFHDDPDKWEQLRSGEKHIASRLATEIKSNSASPRAKISALPQIIRRSIDRGEMEYDEEDVKALEDSINSINDHLHQGVRPFRIALKRLVRTLTEVSMADVRALTAEEIASFREALSYFDGLVVKHGRSA